MSDALAHVCGLGGTRIVAAGFLRKQGAHAVIPGTDTAAGLADTGTLVRDVEAVAARAEVRAGAAAEASVGLSCPEVEIPELGENAGGSL